MMKKGIKWRRWVMLVCCLGLPVTGLLAQSLADDIEQLELDVQKLVQLKQILTEMYQEYEILHTGYEQIKNLSEGTFTLHKVFLDGLLVVSPVVSGYSKVGDVILKEATLIAQYQAAYGYFQGSGRFTPAELASMSLVYGNLLAASERNIDELTMVMTNGTLRMNDGERLGAIDRIDGNMTGQLSLLQSYNDNAALQLGQRQQEAADIGTVRGLYGIGP